MTTRAKRNDEVVVHEQDVNRSGGENSFVGSVWEEDTFENPQYKKFEGIQPR